MKTETINTKRIRDDIANTLLRRDASAASREWLRRNLIKMNERTLIALHGICGVAQKAMNEMDELFDPELDKISGQETEAEEAAFDEKCETQETIITYLQTSALEIIRSETGIGEEHNPLHCGLWIFPFHYLPPLLSPDTGYTWATVR